MQETILSVSGKSGLFKLISQGKNTLIAESLETGKRLPIHARDRVVALQDISMYTTEEDLPLLVVLDKLCKHQDGKEVALEKYQTKEELFDFFGAFVPTFDRERVYPSDVKKLLSWYNLLVASGYTTFLDEEENK